MQTDLRNPPAVAPGSAILNAPGSWRRIAALILAVLAMLLPVLNGATFGMPTSYYLPRTVPWTLLFPVLVTVSLLVPAIPAVAPWLRLLDIASAILGGIISIVIVLDMNQTNQGLNAMADAAGPGGKSLQAQLLTRLIHRTMAVGRFWSDGERDRASVLTPMALDCSVGA